MKRAGKTKLIIFGAKGHARVIADAALRSGTFDVLGFVERDDASAQTEGMKILGHESELPAIITKHPGVSGFVGVGDNRIRRKIVEDIRGRYPDLGFATVVHPSAVIAEGVQLGAGVFVAASVTLNCGTRIGDHAVVNTSASVDHDCAVGDFGFIAPGVVLAGAVKVGAGAFIGTGAVVIPNMDIGNDAIVGAGSVVIRRVAGGTTVAGNPARSITRRNARDAG